MQRAREAGQLALPSPYHKAGVVEFLPHSAQRPLQSAALTTVEECPACFHLDDVMVFPLIAAGKVFVSAAIRWAPYYAVKWSVYLAAKEYGVHRLYRRLVRVRILRMCLQFFSPGSTLSVLALPC